MSTNLVFEQFNQLIIQYLTSIEQENRKVGSILLPDQLHKFFDFSLTEKSDDAKLFQQLQQILDLSPATQSKFFCNQLYAGADYLGIIGDWLATILNTSMATYEVSPVFSLMEKEIFARFANLIGRNEGEYQGLILAGGSLSNQYALHCARTRKNTQSNVHGTQAIYDVYISDQAHYSTKKSMALLGLGTENCIQIKSNEKGEMDVLELERAIKNTISFGRIPLLTVSTSGTTVLGAFDPINAINQICKQYDIRHHVDAAWGGAALLSKSHHNLLDGINKVDSLVINAHKMLRAPQQTSLFFVHDSKLLHQTNSLHADYLFHNDLFAEHNTGDDYIQCARKVDSLKFWLMMKYHGIMQMADRVDTAVSNAKCFYDLLQKNKNFIVYPHQSYANVCFWLIPENLKNKIKNIQDLDLFSDEINSYTLQIKHKMLERGNMMINYQPIKGYPNGFRMVFINPEIQEKDIQNIITEFELLQNSVNKKQQIRLEGKCIHYEKSN